MFTPEEIARVATRLFNEHPQAGPTQQGGVPSMGSPTNSGASLPSVPSEVPHGLSQSQAPQLAMLRGAPITDGQMPAGNATPASGSMHPEFASPASVRPSVPTDPSALGLPTPSASGIPQSSAIPSGVGSFPHGNVPPVTGSGSIISGLTTGLPGSVSELASGSAPASGDGLKRFVQNIRVPHQRSSSGCRDGFEHGFLQKLLSRDFQPKHGARALDVDSIRSDFPILRQQVHGRPLVWFDNAATTQKPQAVIDAISNYYANDNSNIHRAAHTLAARSTDAFEGARQKISQFLGASSPQEIILVRGTTEGINLVANTFGRKFLQPGDEIVLSILEHHANIVPWQMIARDTGAVIRVIPVNDRGEIMMEEYQRILGPRTKLVALAHANNSLGTVLPIGEMIQAAKRYNARVLIDGAQSVSHMPVNVQSLDCDFFVFSGHKLFGPTGIGAVFAKRELMEVMPPWQGGGNMIKSVTFEETSYQGPPARFEAGTPNIADTVGLGAAIDYVRRLGLPNIAKYEHELLEYATEQLSRINGVHLIGSAKEKVSVISFVLPHHKTEEVGRLLDLEGIAVRAGHHCAQPSLRRFGVETTVRPSFSFYNTKDEIDRLADAVRRIQRLPSAR